MTSVGAVSGEWEYGLDLPIGVSTSVDSCVRAFCEVEELAGDNKVYCSACKKNTTHAKKARVEEGKDFMLVTLKRFGEDGAKTEATIRTAPLLTVVSATGETLRYGLRGICEHIGESVRTGHYVSYVSFRASGGWWRCDSNAPEGREEINTPVPAARALEAQGYVFFLNSVERFCF